MLDAIFLYFSGFLGKVELAGTIFSLICVYLAVKHNIWTWFWGALGVICFGYLFYEYKLYSDAGLQILFFLPMQLWGWRVWTNTCAASGEKTTKTLSDLSGATFYLVPPAVLIGVGVLTATFINGGLMAKYTDASFPYVDALTTWMSITAQILMIKKYWESWVVWISMDVIAIFVYLAKGLAVTSGLYVVFLVLATMGLYAWYKDWKKANVPHLGDLA